MCVVNVINWEDEFFWLYSHHGCVAQSFVIPIQNIYNKQTADKSRKNWKPPAWLFIAPKRCLIVEIFTDFQSKVSV